MFSSIANGILIVFFVLSMSMSIFCVSHLNTRFVPLYLRNAFELIFATSFVYIMMILTFHTLGCIFFIYMPLIVALVSMDRGTSVSIALVTAALLAYALWFYRYWDLGTALTFSLGLWIILLIVCWVTYHLVDFKQQLLFLTVIFIIIECIEAYFFLPYTTELSGFVFIIVTYMCFGLYIGIVASYAERITLFHDEVMYTDELTDLHNFRAFNEFLSQPVGNENIMITVFDIDQFKAINDLNGHLIGNEVLKMVVRSITDVLKGQQAIEKYETFRFGGDEIVVALWLGHDEPIDEKDVRHKFNIIRNRIQRYGHEMYRLNVTISSGVSDSRYYQGDLKRTFRAADETLYDVKNAHKNGVAFDLPPKVWKSND